MSGDGPLSIDADGMLRWESFGVLYVGQHAAAADQLDRARRCAEAEAELEQSNDALRTAREAMGADDLPFLNDGITRLRAERDAALAEAQQVKADLAFTMEMSETTIRRLRAELAARPDLTELRQAYQDYPESDILEAVYNLFADPTPAPTFDTVTITVSRSTAYRISAGLTITGEMRNEINSAASAALDGAR